MRSSLPRIASPPPRPAWVGVVPREPSVIVRDLERLAERCRLAIPSLRRAVRDARRAVDRGHPDRGVRAELRDRLRELEVDLEAAEIGRIEARCWLAELRSVCT